MSSEAYTPSVRPGASHEQGWWYLAGVVLSLLVASLGLRWAPVLAVETAAVIAMLIVCVAWPWGGVLAVTALTLGLDAIPIATGNEWITLRPFTSQTHLFHSFALSSRLLWMPYANILQVFLLASFLSWAVRRAREGRLRWRGGVLAMPLGILALALLAALLHGMAKGGDWMMGRAEVHALFHLIVTYVVIAHMIERRAQVEALVWTAIGAFLLRVAVIWWNTGAALHFDLSGVDTVTGHEDALFFVSLFLLWALLRLYRTGRGQRLLLELTLIPMLGAFIFAKRRAAIVTGAFILPYLLMLLDWRRALRAVGTGTLACAFFGLYAVAFWNNTGIIALPLRMARSLGEVKGESRDASSNRYRIVENTLLLADIRGNALAGKGFGQVFVNPEEVAAGGADSASGTGFFLGKDPSLRFVAHNQILWLWLKAGIGGFMALWFAVTLAIAHGTHLARTLKTPYFRALAALTVLVVGAQMISACFDMGLTGFRNMGYLGTLLGTMARLRGIEQREADSILRVKS